MGLLARLEGALTQLIEGCSSRLVGGRLSPRQVVAAAAGAVARQPLDDGTEVACNLVTVRLHPDDLRHLADQQDGLVREAALRLRQSIEGRGWPLAGRPEVRLVSDEAVAAGRLELVTEVRRGPGAARLRRLDPPGPSFGLAVRAQVLGREPACDICLDCDGVSRRHARIEPAADHFVISDLGSTNGTLVEGRRISRQPLRHGQQIQIGPVRLVFEEL